MRERAVMVGLLTHIGFAQSPGAAHPGPPLLRVTLPGALMRSVLSGVVVGLLLTSGLLAAQAPGGRRIGVALSGGVATVPDGLGAQCGRNGGGANSDGLEASGALLVRPWRWVVLGADARTVRTILPTGCTLVLFSVDTAYPPRSKGNVNSATVRIGFETPPNMPLVRASLGVGRVLGSPRVPVRSLAVAVGTRGKRGRLLVEAERLQSRINAMEEHNDPGQPSRIVPIVLRPISHAVRVGVELPLLR